MKTLAATMVLLAIPYAASGDESRIAEVRCAEIGFAKALKARDRERVRAVLDPETRFVGTGVARGPDEVLESWAPFFEAGGPELVWRPQIVEVVDDGRLALSRGPYRIRATAEDGSATEAWGTFNSVWRRNEDGRWRVVFDAGSQPIETPTDEARALIEQPKDDCPAT